MGGGGGGVVDLFSFFSVVLEWKKRIITGMFRLTIPNHTFMHLTIFVHNITH